MQLNKFTNCQKFEIWSPRWHDRTVLLDARRIGTHNEIVFTKVKSGNYSGSSYISGDIVKQCPLDNNGKIPCYAIPLDKLEPLERID